MRTKELLLVLLISGLCIKTALPQDHGKERVISGTVRDNNNRPMANAVVLIDGEYTSEVTNSSGKYKVKVKPDAAEIAIMTLGSGMMLDSIGGRSKIDFDFISLTETEEDKELKPGQEPVNMGYNTVRKRDLTNAVGLYNAGKAKKTYHSIAEMLREIPELKMHTIATMNGDFVGPLLVINGIAVHDLESIRPEEVESIVYLKDASAAIYGSRAFGGVLLIKTKTNLIDK
jgi:TonB-dependent SusC/RagA subfamily outer membrane receptor